MVDSTNLPAIDINAIATDLNNKADRDLSNFATLSQSFINEITNNMMPDYTRLQTITSPFTAPYNGLVLWQNSGTGNPTINGRNVYVGGNDASNEGSVTLILSKDDVINFNSDSGTPCFIPFKGSV